MHVARLRSLVAVASLWLAGCPNTVGPAGDANPPTDTASTDATSTDTASADTVSMPPALLTCSAADAGVAYPASAFACSSRADCTVVVHGLDCCGSLEMVGVNAAHMADFDGPEMACQTAVHFNMCDCVSRQPIAQDGRGIPGGSMASVDCVGGACVTFVP